MISVKLKVGMSWILQVGYRFLWFSCWPQVIRKEIVRAASMAGKHSKRHLPRSATTLRHQLQSLTRSTGGKGVQSLAGCSKTRRVCKMWGWVSCLVNIPKLLQLKWIHSDYIYLENLIVLRTGMWIRSCGVEPSPDQRGHPGRAWRSFFLSSFSPWKENEGKSPWDSGRDEGREAQAG